MTHDLVLPVAGAPALPGALAVPAAVADAGAAAARRYVEFFAAEIRNPNTPSQAFPDEFVRPVPPLSVYA